MYTGAESDTCTQGYNPCIQAIRTAAAMDARESDRYWRTNSDIAELESNITIFCTKADRSLTKAQMPQQEAVKPISALETAILNTECPDGSTGLLCDPVLRVEALPDVNKTTDSSFKTQITPLTQIGAVTMHI